MNFKKNLSMLAMLCSTQQALANDLDLNGAFIIDNTLTSVSSSLDSGDLTPISAAFTSNETLLTQPDNGPYIGSTLSTDPLYIYSTWDTYSDQFLTVNTTLANFAQFANFSIAPDLSTGILFDANSNFTLTYECIMGSFCGIIGTTNYSPDLAFQTLNITEASTTNPVPESGALALLMIGLVGSWVLNRKKTTG